MPFTAPQPGHVTRFTRNGAAHPARPGLRRGVTARPCRSGLPQLSADASTEPAMTRSGGLRMVSGSHDLVEYVEYRLVGQDPYVRLACRVRIGAPQILAPGPQGPQLLPCAGSGALDAPQQFVRVHDIRHVPRLPRRRRTMTRLAP